MVHEQIVEYDDIGYDQIMVADYANDRIQILQLNSYGAFSSYEMTFVTAVSDVGPLLPALKDPAAVASTYENGKQIICVGDTPAGGPSRVVRLEVEYDRPGCSPVHAFEGFKAALWAGDTDWALTFIAEISRERYAVNRTKAAVLQTSDVDTCSLFENSAKPYV